MSPLTWKVEVIEGELECPESGRKFPITEGIPNMLLREDEVWSFVMFVFVIHSVNWFTTHSDSSYVPVAWNKDTSLIPRLETKTSPSFPGLRQRRSLHSQAWDKDVHFIPRLETKTAASFPGLRQRQNFTHRRAILLYWNPNNSNSYNTVTHQYSGERLVVVRAPRRPVASFPWNKQKTFLSETYSKYKEIYGG